MILSQRGWIRAMKGHVELEQIADLKFREGDGPLLRFHAQTTDPAARRGERPLLHARRRQAAGRPRLRRAGPADDRHRRRGRDRRSCLSRGRRRSCCSPRRDGAASSRAARRARRDPQGQAARQPAARRQGRGGQVRSGGRRLSRGDRREPQDGGLPLAELPELGRGQGVSCSAIATAACPTHRPSASRTASAGRWAARAGASGPKPT